MTATNDIKIYSDRFVSPFDNTEDLASQTTISSSESFCIQNKTSHTILVNINTNKPDADSTEGLQLVPNEEFCFPATVSGFHVKLLNSQFLTTATLCLYSGDIKDNQVPYTGNRSQSVDFEGKQSMNTIFGEQTVAEREDRINIAFQYNISDRDVVSTTTGTGLIQHLSSARASVEMGTGVGTATIQSKEAIRYVAGKEMVCNFTADFSEGEANTYQYAGIFDSENGFAVGYNGTQFGMLFRSSSVDIFVPYDDFNAKPSDFKLDPNFYSIYKISYGWLGVAPAILSVYGGHTKGWIALHIIDYSSGQHRPHIANPVLPITIEVGRTSGTGSNLTVLTSSWRGGIVGKSPKGTSADRTFTKDITTNVPSGNNKVPVITIRNKATFQGITNHVRARYGTVTLSTDGNKAVVITIYRGGTLTGGTFVDYDPDNSVCQYNITATDYTPPNEAPIGGTILGKVDKLRVNLFENDVVIPIYPNEDITLCAESANSSELLSFIRHIEEF